MTAEVVVLVRPGVLPMELGLIHQMFGTARSPTAQPLYRVRSCGLTPGEILTEADFSVRVAHGLEALRDADTVILPASHELDESDTVLDHGLRQALTASGARRIASICTAAFVLAAAGLLDGRRATTHWLAAETFRRRYPGVFLDPNVLFTDEGSVLTSAGEASGIDLCLHMIRQDHGAAVANEVARRNIVPPFREGGQAQYIPRPATSGTASDTTALRQWVAERLERPHTLDDLAQRLQVSRRTLTRRFAEEVGTSPMQWLLTQRLGQARELLETTNLTIEEVASCCGFVTAASMRAHFQQELGVSPRRYRMTFRGR